MAPDIRKKPLGVWHEIVLRWDGPRMVGDVGGRVLQVSELKT